MSMRMILRSSDDATLFDNKPYDFNVQLDKTHIEGNGFNGNESQLHRNVKTGERHIRVYECVHRKYRRKIRKTSAFESPHRYE
jgi:hypothetical protein